jgi:hypothetical protein
MLTATQTQDKVEWSLSPEQKQVRERIYSGRSETVLLTVTIQNPIPPAGAASIELLVNGAATANGVLNKQFGATSRTWLLFGVKTLDLQAKSKGYCSGQYAISVEEVAGSQK